ncbi:MAG: squalene synthase HpnC [Rhodospirillales bacterium]|nr:squalene synthase HpnC [Rhodospirillales bacterium]MBO6788803.1 squalene synthase HpnC [Rhodospirillales bacterium]
MNTSAPLPEAAIETPSGKDAAYENFPVDSFLLPPRARPHVAVFYRYARAIDDIADNPDLDADEKIRRLEGFAAAVRGDAGVESAFETGTRMRDSLLASGVPERHCLDLVDAFKQDAVKSRYDDWDDLMGYCLRSAAPVGRYLIDLTGGTTDDYASSDALCNALQVINHLQDCKDDYVSLDRVYLPMNWMRDAGADVQMLSADSAAPQLRAVIDRCLRATADLMTDARPLPGTVASRRLAMESAAIIRIADALIAKLSRYDPLGQRVELSKLGYARCVIRGAAAGMFA